ncbi:MAG: polysaccharide biosynthesis tyrosine autokinase [Methylacidiphilales bacterium]|nr:polysaccharide biosynthesis tyrosine autokinase [Candidatus Methylacidiphilales bacterium]MDW8349257.1 polysaccharide biosynthesis tyrosine autokinase [Verrucomicrobiae bacterium]
MVSQSKEGELHFLDYWRVIKNRLPIIITVLVLTVASGYFTTVYLITKVYAATAQIQVNKPQRDIEVFRRDHSNFYDPHYFQSEFELIQSKKILYPVIEKLGLDKVYAQRLLKQDTPLPVDLMYDYLTKNLLKLDYRRGTNIITITGLSEDPEEAARIANSIAQVYIDTRREDEKARASRGLKSLSEEIEKQRKVVAESRQKVEALRKELGIDAVPGGLKNDTQLADVELQRKSMMLDEARADAIARKVRIERLKNMTTEQLLDTLPALNLMDDNLIRLRQDQLDIESEITRLISGGLGTDHPRVQAAQAKLRKVREQIMGMVEGKRNALEIDYEVSQARVRQLEEEVKNLTERVRRDKGEKLAPFLQAEKEAESQHDILQALIIRYKQESADTQIEIEPAELISHAEPPIKPHKPNLLLNIILSILVGGVLGLACAFFIEYLDTSVKTVEEVEKYLGLNVVGVVPNNMCALNQLPPDAPDAEAYRILRAKIDLKPKRGEGNSLTLISGGPGEGKSLTIFNLAYVCAQTGQSVLIVDADLRRPTQHKYLQIPREHGLADLLQGKGEPYEYIKSTSVPNLHIITAGKVTSDRIGLMNATKIREILADLRQRYDIVLFDSPPILGISDGSVIVHEVDKTLLVIQHRRYPRQVCLKAKEAIEQVNGNLVGVVLNNVAINTHESYYYYSTYQYYQHIDEDEEDKPKPIPKTQSKQSKERQKNPPSPTPAGRTSPTTKENTPSRDTTKHKEAPNTTPLPSQQVQNGKKTDIQSIFGSRNGSESY